MLMSNQIVSKGDFAKLCNVSPGRVTQWITEGKISGDAIVGEGRSAKIDAALAQKQIGLRRDVVQSLGNGLKTRLSPSSAKRGEAAKPDLSDEINEETKRQRLEGIRRQNRREAEEELARQGRYIEATGARREMNRIAEELVRVFEGALPEFATAIASEFKIEQRDVLHLLRDQFRKVRTKAAGKARQAAADKPALVSDGVEDPEEA
jgi:hypothetical protein